MTQAFAAATSALRIATGAEGTPGDQDIAGFEQARHALDLGRLMGLFHRQREDREQQMGENRHAIAWRTDEQNTICSCGGGFEGAFDRFPRFPSVGLIAVERKDGWSERPVLVCGSQLQASFEEATFLKCTIAREQLGIGACG